MAVTKDTLKKHHFWIMVGATPVLVLIAVILIDSAVGAKIDEKNKAIDAAKNSLKGKESPKSNVLLSRFGTQLDELGRKRTDLWKENWERQIGLAPGKAAGKEALVQDPGRNLLRWPKSPLLNRFNYTVEYATNKSQLKFGEKIPDDSGEYGEFSKPEVYLAEFSNPYLKDIAREPEKRTGMADRIYPTSFAGGWTSVLRHVQSGSGGWVDMKPTSEQLWLALEDIWVERAMLDAIKTVNDSVGTFQRAPRYDANNAPVPDANLERAFMSRIWYVSLKVAQRPGDGRYVITGTLRNITDRLQLLGASNTLVLNVWLSTAPNAPPIPFRIGGEFVAGGATMPISQAEEHVLPAGTTVEQIVRVEQVFDTKTVPIRRIDHLALGKRDSRYAAFPLVRPLFEAFKKDEEKTAAAAGSGGSDSGPPAGMTIGGSAGGPPPGLGGGKPPPGSAGPGGPGATAAEGQLEGGGSVASAIDSNRKRYVEATAQIRRMPVGITIIVDQAYMQDVLMAYANLPMRFQITQYHWKRFRDTLGGSGSVGGYGPGGEGDFGGAARGYEGSGGIKFGPMGFGPGAGPPAPGGPGPMGAPPPMPGGPGPMGMGPPGGFGGIAGGTFSDAQLTAGLVELTIYGIVSLYEKYEAPPAQP